MSGKKVVLAVSGGIAAYKSAELCRLFVKAGVEVRVVMTQGAQAFLAPLTFQALTGNSVHTELLDPEAEAGMGHIELAKWPDYIVVAPATADLIARYAQGLANDLLTSLLLATEAPVILAPAMNQAMWRNPLTQRNVAELIKLFDSKVKVLGPQSGEQACGDVGPGRMLEPVQIYETLADIINDETKPTAEKLLSGKKFVITAGPTREALDPVRYITNHSSGKMGFAIAQAAKNAGANVLLIAGPVSLAEPKGVERVDVESAQEMYTASMRAVDEGCDVFIASAAVADYRPANCADEKIKKQGDQMNVPLVKNPDIVASVAEHAKVPYVVGFAAETQDVINYAKGKLKNKKLDMIVANDVSKPGIGFNSDHNEVHVVTEQSVLDIAHASKEQIAQQLIQAIAAKLAR